jgi:YkoY family integral membrane protein
MMFGQTFDVPDIFVILMLVVLEGVLSIDNALVLGLLAKRLPVHQQKRALTYGLIGAFVFRLLAIATATYLLKWTIFKLLGGAYLLWVAIKHFAVDSRSHDKESVTLGPDGMPLLGQDNVPLKSAGRAVAKFWPTVFVIEMTDIAFAVDSIVAAIAFVGPAPRDLPAEALHPKLWVVLIGGFMGVILMRLAAVIFIKLLEKFPRFETSAYLLVIVIGLKLVVDWAANTKEHPHRVDFHSPTHVEFWAFWILMLACFGVGFIPKNRGRATSSAAV